MKSSLQLAIVLGLIAVMSVLPAILVYVQDPFQMLRPIGGGEIMLRHPTRFQNAGLIRTFLADPKFEFDTVVIGASHAANYRPSVIQKELGIKRAMNLSMDGGRVPTQLAVLENALHHNNVKRVIWSIGRQWFNTNRVTSNPQHIFPEHFYRNESFHRYLFNHDNVNLSIKNLSNRHLPDKTLDQYGNWFRDDRWFNDRSDLFWAKKIGDPGLQSAVMRWAIEESEQELDSGFHFPSLDLLEKVLGQHPDIRFELVLPPHPAIYWASVPRARFIAGRIRLASFAQAQSNVNLFSFDHLREITTDLGLFKDLTHFHQSVSDRILESIGRGENQCTPDAHPKMLEEWRGRVEEERAAFLEKESAESTP